MTNEAACKKLDSLIDSGELTNIDSDSTVLEYEGTPDEFAVVYARWGLEQMQSSVATVSGGPGQAGGYVLHFADIIDEYYVKLSVSFNPMGTVTWSLVSWIGGPCELDLSS